MTTTRTLGIGRRSTTSAGNRARALVAATAFAGLLVTAATSLAGDPPRVASRSTNATARSGATLPPSASASPVVDTTLGDPVLAAKKAIVDCQARFLLVNDYTCTFVKRERINGKLQSPHVMSLKARTRPTSFYMKFKTPNKGREAIFVVGRNKGKVVAHDVGLFKVLAGTMNLDPRGEIAMDGCRHPVTEAGIGGLIDTVARHWASELTPEESKVAVHTGLRIGPAEVTMIESVHPEKNPNFLFHKVKLYIDHAHGLPVRFEAYDWPRHPGAAPELVEEYTYTDLMLNVGLTEQDFDPGNRAYSFGRF